MLVKLKDSPLELILVHGPGYKNGTQNVSTQAKNRANMQRENLVYM